ncbi:MAG TPA: transcriptional regulator [Gemmatimonadota bacterium]|nr:transcriptional regulator [Gemmatimonadota bacterium]
MPEEPDAGIQERLDALDRLLEHRVRLAICVLLTRYDRLSFSRLKDATGETDGSLGAHMKRLEDAGYVRVTKRFINRKPVTWYALTAAGRAALAGHLAALESLIDEAR